MNSRWGEKRGGEAIETNTRREMIRSNKAAFFGGIFSTISISLFANSNEFSVATALKGE